MTVRPGTARAVAEAVLDPELPLLSLAELGVLREVQACGDRVTVSITPTYCGCPALDAIRADLEAALRGAGYRQVEIRTVLAPQWTTDWITEAGRRKLADAGIAPPGPAPSRPAGPVPLTLHRQGPRVPCPRCGHPDTDELSEFGSTACKALRRCPACREPFEHVKEI